MEASVHNNPRTVAEDLDLCDARRIVKTGFDGYRVRLYLFGSRARGDAGRASDIDIGVMPLESVPPAVWSRVREALEDSNILYHVDVVDLANVSPEFRRNVESEAIDWSDSANV
ncbi:MAG TPA: nucleotidyltransferase domain-containing protein [Limnochordia bacterium]|nr:nucleotidyltransferase domain-containing protein [Limnochordia bacterium]